MAHLGFHLFTYPLADPGGWLVGYGPYHISYSSADRYRLDGHPFRIQWRGGFVAFGKFSRWGKGD